MEFETVIYEVDNKIATITLNRPGNLNAFNAQMTLDVKEATDAVYKDSSIRCVILTGAGKGFSAGADLNEPIGPSSDPDAVEKGLLEGYKPIFMNIINMPKPVISAVRGPAAGIGFALAMACDLTVMSEEAYLLSVFSNIGLVPDGGANWLLTKTKGVAGSSEPDTPIVAPSLELARQLRFDLVDLSQSLAGLFGLDELGDARPVLRGTPATTSGLHLGEFNPMLIPQLLAENGSTNLYRAELQAQHIGNVLVSAVFQLGDGNIRLDEFLIRNHLRAGSSRLLLTHLNISQKGVTKMRVTFPLVPQLSYDHSISSIGIVKVNTPTFSNNLQSR